MILFDMGEISNLAIIAALGVLGYQLYTFERRYAKDKAKQAFDSARAVEAVSEGRVLIEQLKNETVRLQREKSLAQTVGDQLSMMISEAEAEAENTERVARELKSVVKSADRSHASILNVVNSVAELHRVFKPDQDVGLDFKTSSSRRKSSMNEAGKKMKSGISNTNIVKFPSVK